MGFAHLIACDQLDIASIRITPGEEIFAK